MVGVQHLANVGQPIAQAPVHLVLLKRSSGLDRPRGQGEHQCSVSVRKQAKVQAALQDERLEAGWQLHGWSLQRARQRRNFGTLARREKLWARNPTANI